MMTNVLNLALRQQPARKKRARTLYQRIWRWHFFAGLFVIPFAVILALSGSIYLFKAEIEGAVEADINTRGSLGEPLSADQLYGFVRSRYPDAALRIVTLAKENDPSIEMLVRVTDGRNRLLWVNEADGRILHDIAPQDRFMHLVEHLHGQLLSGKNGSLVVELAASWMIVMIVTGLYLGWPRGRPFFTILIPDLTGPKRQVWKNLHISIGFWASILILGLLITGLPWTGVWGDNFAKFRNAVGWTGLSNSASPSASVPEAWHITHKEETTAAIDLNAHPISLSSVHARARKETLGETLKAPVQIIPPAGDAHEWQIRSNAQNRYDRVTIYLDKDTGEETRRISFQDRHIATRIVSYGIAYHEGALFGWPNKILGVITALSVIFLAISGAVMWWRRRPSGKLAAPQKADDQRLKAPLTILVCFFALFLPLVGASLLSVLILEWLWGCFATSVGPFDRTRDRA